MEKKIEIGKNGKVEIKWNLLPIDFSCEAENNLKVKFANKYGISKDNIRVTPHFIKKNENGVIEEYENDITRNIQEPQFQQQLFKSYLKEREITDIDFDKILEIDNVINNGINYTVYEQNKRYTIKWIKWDNFMSYGKGNYFDFTTLNGLILFMSNPANQGGKTTFCLDLFRFLLFGKVTRENDWVLAKVFNKHIPEATEVVVEGCINIDGVDYVIKRTVSRPALNKRTDKSKVSQKIDYYKLVNDEYIDLYDEECENEKTTTETNKAIKNALGDEKDFDLMICIDADNLKDLISLKDTDRGRLISRWIGLLPLEEKEKVAREKFNKEIMPSLVINRYNKEELKADVATLQESNANFENENKKKGDELQTNVKELDKNNKKRDELLSSKKNVDDSLLKVDVVTLEAALKSTMEEGKNKRGELELNQTKLKEIGVVNFSEEEYKSLQTQEKTLLVELADDRAEYKKIQLEIEALKRGEYCPTCGAKLKNVDNTAKINEKNQKLQELIKIGGDKKGEADKLSQKIKDLEENRVKFNEKNKLEVIISKNEVDLERLLTKYKDTKKTIKDIEDNKTAIAENNKIQNELNIINTAITTINGNIDRIKGEIASNKASIDVNNKTITQHQKLIETIESEEILVKTWRVYLELIGKNGISKMVIRAVLPLINGELRNLLSNVCDFEVEVSIDDHNDVAFSLIHDGVKSSLGSGSGFEKTVSSLALRTVLSKISTFSKPSFVVFDEILGGVNAENYDAIKRLYDKMVDSYGTILEITHNEALHDWHKKTVVIEKNNNISKIKVES